MQTIQIKLDDHLLDMLRQVNKKLDQLLATKPENTAIWMTGPEYREHYKLCETTFYLHVKQGKIEKRHGRYRPCAP